MKEISVVELATIQDRVVVDVREQDEYLAARVPGATHVPLSQIDRRSDEIPDSGPVYVICALGGRSLKASSILAQKGIDAINVIEGTNGWIAAGLPTVSGEETA